MLEALEQSAFYIDIEKLPLEVTATGRHLSLVQNIEPGEIDLESEPDHELPLYQPWSPSLRLQVKLYQAEKAAAKENPPKLNDPIGLFLQKAGKYPLLDAVDEVELARAIEKGEVGAKDILVNCNLRLVYSRAKRYMGYGLPIPDHLHNGVLGLIRAAEKFDWRRGYKFSTYARDWIDQEILNQVDNKSRIIRFPVYLAQRDRKIEDTTEAHIKKTGREPTQEEIAALADLSLEEVAVVQEAPRTISLDLDWENKEPLFYSKLEATSGTASAEYRTAEEEVAQRLLAEDIAAAFCYLRQCDDLDSLGQTITEMHFGLGNHLGTKPLKVISQELGLPHSRVQSTFAKTRKKLACSANLQPYCQN